MTAPVHVELNLTESGLGCRVVVDGADISRGVTSIKIEASVGRPTVVSLTMFADVSGAVETGEVEET